MKLILFISFIIAKLSEVMPSKINHTKARKPKFNTELFDAPK